MRHDEGSDNIWWGGLVSARTGRVLVVVLAVLVAAIWVMFGGNAAAIALIVIACAWMVAAG